MEQTIFKDVKYVEIRHNRDEEAGRAPAAKYGADPDLDYLLMAAQGYGVDPRSERQEPFGAISVMQVMPRPASS